MQNMNGKTILYRYFDIDGNLLYVGITKDQSKRFSSHNRKAEWMPQAVQCTLEHFETRAEAKAAETFAIQNEKPLYNIAETGKQRKSAHWRLSSEAHLIQMTGSPEGWFDKEHWDFQRDFMETIYGLPADTPFDWIEFLAFSYDLLKSNTNKSYLNLQNCEDCIAIEKSPKIRFAVERAKMKLAGVMVK